MYEVGDKAKIRTHRSLKNEFGENCLASGTERWCGKEVTITRVNYRTTWYFYGIENSGSAFSELAFEPAAVGRD